MDLKQIIIKWNGGISRGAISRFAERIGKNRVTVSRWVTQDWIPLETERPKISKELGITVDQLMLCFSQSATRETRQTYRPEQLPEAMSANRPIPFFGNVCAGASGISFDAIPESFLPISMPIPHDRRVGAWVVQGDCMDDGSVEAIHEGDILVVMEQAYADNGKIVVAMLNGEVTVKQIIHRGGKTELRPKNPKHKPVIVNTEDFQILGVVVYSFRRH